MNKNRFKQHLSNHELAETKAGIAPLAFGIAFGIYIAKDGFEHSDQIMKGWKKANNKVH